MKNLLNFTCLTMKFHNCDRTNIKCKLFCDYCQMVEKYGAPGNTDSEGFDPYSDSVGPGIYGGRVKRDQHGEIVIGKQYQVRKMKIFLILLSETWKMIQI